jgi:cation-transporting ATPase F
VLETLLAGALCNDAALYHEHRQWLITGDPTEAALLVLARKAGLDETTLRNVFPRRTNCPSIRRARPWRRCTRSKVESVAYAKGAIEKLLPACRAMLAADGGEVPLDAAHWRPRRGADGGARPARAGPGAARHGGR